MSTRRQILRSALGLAGAMALAPHALAQALTKPVKVIVGFPAGGGTDIIARVLADRLRGAYAETVVVENKPGGAARLSVEFVKNAEPDGTTILVTPDFPLTVYPHSFRTLSYDPLKDVTPVAPITRSLLTFNVGPGVPESVKTVADFVAWCKANPSKSSYGTTAAGSTTHFAGAMLSAAAGVPMQAVHYRGGAPALQDLLGGHIPASVNPVSEAMPLANQGQLRILAVTGSRRSKFLPNVPTLKEAGYDVVVDSWIGVFAPANMPANRVAALSKAIETAVKSPEYASSLAKFGNEPDFEAPDAFAKRFRADVAKWGPVVKASGFVAQD
ncbi:MAG TPA: Bug family tripartite tricarboxylate transporter substrate binding protein [Xanthobacteraceae bacterium]|nr:Bug family tripartite tricarboxylate transporter substrate binding protein [Xanthobacteraceae bacterium]